MLFLRDQELPQSGTLHSMGVCESLWEVVMGLFGWGEVVWVGEGEGSGGCGAAYN